MVVYRRVPIKSALSKSGLPDLDYALNPYVGCFHACIYCYARGYVRDREVSENWGEIVYVKDQLVDVLMRELRRARKGRVGVSTITDPYQPVEARERLTRGGVKMLLEAGFKVSIQTKSDLVVRDLDVLSQFRELVDVGFTITTIDNNIAAEIEPRASPPSKRITALERIARRGIRTWVFLGPIIPGLNDSEDSIRAVAEVAAKTRSTLYYDVLRVKPWIIKPMTEGLRRSDVRSVFKAVRDLSWLARIRRIVSSVCAELGVECEPEF